MFQKLHTDYSHRCLLSSLLTTTATWQNTSDKTNPSYQRNCNRWQKQTMMQSSNFDKLLTFALKSLIRLVSTHYLITQ